MQNKHQDCFSLIFLSQPPGRGESASWDKIQTFANFLSSKAPLKPTNTYLSIQIKYKHIIWICFALFVFVFLSVFLSVFVTPSILNSHIWLKTQIQPLLMLASTSSKLLWARTNLPSAPVPVSNCSFFLPPFSFLNGSLCGWGDVEGEGGGRRA